MTKKTIEIITKDDTTKSYRASAMEHIDDVCGDEQLKKECLKYRDFLDDILEGNFEIIIENCDITIKSKNHEETIENRFV